MPKSGCFKGKLLHSSLCLNFCLKCIYQALMLRKDYNSCFFQVQRWFERVHCTRALQNCTWVTEGTRRCTYIFTEHVIVCSTHTHIHTYVHVFLFLLFAPGDCARFTYTIVPMRCGFTILRYSCKRSNWTWKKTNNNVWTTSEHHKMTSDKNSDINCVLIVCPQNSHFWPVSATQIIYFFGKNMSKYLIFVSKFSYYL